MEHTALIGYSGFVGSNILNYLKKKNLKKLLLINSKNLSKLKKKKFKKIYFCALPATKWLSNKFPIKDKKNIDKIKKILNHLNCEDFILISTIDIHNKKEYYGKSRLSFEKYIFKKFKKAQIIRLPGLFGRGLKKNVIFDLLNNKNINNIFISDRFQWLDIKDFIKFLNKLDNGKRRKRLYELYPEPLANKEFIKCFKKFKIIQERKVPINYNFRPKSGFFMKKKTVIKKIKAFIKEYRNEKQ